MVYVVKDSGANKVLKDLIIQQLCENTGDVVERKTSLNISLRNLKF